MRRQEEKALCLWVASYACDLQCHVLCVIFNGLSRSTDKLSPCANLQIPVFPSHCWAVLPELLAADQWRVGHGCCGTPNLERWATSYGPDQMGLSAAVWFIPFLLVKVYHSSGTLDSAGPLGSVSSGFIPGGKSLKITWTWVLDVKVCFIQWISGR